MLLRTVIVCSLKVNHCTYYIKYLLCISCSAVDKSLSVSMGDARDALVNSCIDMLTAYGNTLTSSQRMGQLPCPYTLRLMPLYLLALLKFVSIFI